ncbi:MAG: ABC transporter permease [Chloroflexota bacterium]|nr:ABC transporter permease [Chloroflexota bacterium]
MAQRTADPSSLSVGAAGSVASVTTVEQPGDMSSDYEVALKTLNQWQLAWRRFRRHKLALVGSVLFGLMVFLAIFGPIIWPYDALDLHRISRPGGDPPSLAQIFGTDSLGRSVFELVANGARLSMAVGIVTMVIATSLGVMVGAMAGYFGGIVDNLLMRLVDLMLALPFLFIILVAARFFGSGDPIVIMVIFGVLSWPGLARLVRALFLSLREQEYVLAARAVGVGHFRIALRHMLPNALGPIIVSATLLVASAIVTEAFVSFLNFGIRSSDISWGTALSRSQGTLIQGNWWWPFFPGMAIAVTVIGINFMGDGLRDAFDPRARA